MNKNITKENNGGFFLKYTNVTQKINKKKTYKKMSASH